MPGDPWANYRPTTRQTPANGTAPKKRKGSGKGRAKARTTPPMPQTTSTARRKAVRSAAPAKQKTQVAKAKAPNPRRYFDPFFHSTPPPLSTSYGRFTTVNSVSRFTWTTSTSVPTLVVVPWTPSAVAAFSVSPTGQIGGYQLSQLHNANTSPLEIRPLRMSARLTNITRNIDLGGNVQVLMSDQPLKVGWSFPVSGATIGITNSVDFATMITEHPRTQTIGGFTLGREHSFVGAPSSFVSYNSYKTFTRISSPSSTAATQYPASDWWDWLCNNPDSTPGSDGITPYLAGGSTFAEGVLADAPPFPMMMFYFPPTSTGAQTYQFQVNRQDGARYPSNTFAASLAKHSPVPATGHDQALQKAAQDHHDSVPGLPTGWGSVGSG